MTTSEVHSGQASKRPLILLDIDGVLNPLRRPGADWRRFQALCGGGSMNVWLNPAHGPMLLNLAEETGAELVWATTWEHDANRSVAPLLGLPELPVIEVLKGEEIEPSGCCWKIPAVAEYVNRRPFVWFDDDLSAADFDWLADHPNVDTFRLMEIDPLQGISDADFEEAAAWLASPAATAGEA